MSFKHILVRLNDEDVVDSNNTIEQNKCIQKKKDYLDCVKLYPKNHDYFSGKLTKNRCTQLFWNWYNNCRMK
jgi:hypothetical protein